MTPEEERSIDEAVDRVFAKVKALEEDGMTHEQAVRAVSRKMDKIAEERYLFERSIGINREVRVQDVGYCQKYFMEFSERLDLALQKYDLCVILEGLYLAPAIEQTVNWAIDMLNRGWDTLRVREALDNQLIRLREMGRLEREDEEAIRQALKGRLPNLFGSDIR